MEAVVVDAGSKLLKIGFASPDQDPALLTWVIMPTKMKRVLEDGDGGGDVSMVEEVTANPVVRGFIRDWDAMEDLLQHVLYIDLGWEVGDEGQILSAEPLFTPKAFMPLNKWLLSLHAVGHISGCTVDIGHWKIDIAPVCEGVVQHIASKRFQIGGIDLTNLLAQKLKKSNPLVKVDISEVEKLIEQYTLCFSTSFIYGIVEQLVRSISSVSSENLRQLLENTMLCGGTTSMTARSSFPPACLINLPDTLGFEERFQKEANLCSSSIRPSLIKPPEYMPENLSKNSAWMGGVILAKVVFPQNQHVTRGDYDETGPTIIHKKMLLGLVELTLGERHCCCIIS
ncbi:hypothetical protein ZIOFF_007191 [Zingiber officinale]|uniref:Actin-related protein 7 n=1 Tax=Zingiber officinale TaxID=94328 RepID=A0A8J5LSU3_ZINOF|nr:hypothetical protein ZIOFF_007191 [Zingiber officinale]